MKRCIVNLWTRRFCLALACLLSLTGVASGQGLPPIKTVFLIVMENTDWSLIKNSPNAPFINNVLLNIGSYCGQYYDSAVIHPSAPNYIWLESGTNFGIFINADPAVSHFNTTNHLTAQLHSADISWKSYQEDIDGETVPLAATNHYVPRHNPFLYFEDVAGTNYPTYPYGVSHIRPYAELASDLASNTVAAYNFITPNLCNDMHDPCYPYYNQIRQGDLWLSSEIPRIMASSAYTNNGAIFVTWDESSLPGYSNIGMMVISPLAKGGGYYNDIAYSHSSTLRTFQEIFGVRPFLGDAANANDLSDLFTGYSIWGYHFTPDGKAQFNLGGTIPGGTNIIQSSPDLKTWTKVGQVVSSGRTCTFTQPLRSVTLPIYYRALQVP